MDENKVDEKTTKDESQPSVVIHNNVTISGKNSVGLAGLILAIISVFLGWIPVIGWILWVAGALCSIIGLFKTPKGTAIAGFIISFFDLILLLTVFASLFAAFHH